MSVISQSIHERTVETLAQSFFKESSRYGFDQVDYLRFVNALLDMSMKQSEGPAQSETEDTVKTVIEEGPPGGSHAYQFPISGGRVAIRAFDTGRDLTQLENWVADKSGRYFILSRTSGRAGSLHDIVNDPSNILGVITLKDHTPIGIVAFLDYEDAHKKAELRKLIGDSKMRGKGLAKEATELWIQYGIRSMGLKKIYLSTLDTNIRNIKMNESLGFKIEGLLKNEAFFDGEYHDVLRMGLVIDSSGPDAGALIPAKPRTPGR